MPPGLHKFVERSNGALYCEYCAIDGGSDRAHVACPLSAAAPVSPRSLPSPSDGSGTHHVCSTCGGFGAGNGSPHSASPSGSPTGVVCGLDAAALSTARHYRALLAKPPRLPAVPGAKDQTEVDEVMRILQAHHAATTTTATTITPAAEGSTNEATDLDLDATLRPATLKLAARFQSMADITMVNGTMAPSEIADAAFDLLWNLFHALSDQHITLVMDAIRTMLAICCVDDANIHTLVRSGSLVHLVATLVLDEYPQLQELSLWLLGTLLGDNADTREAILKAGILEPLVELIRSPATSHVLVRRATWALVGLCEGPCRPALTDAKVLCALYSRLSLTEDDDVLCDVLMCISRLCDGSSNVVESVVTHGVCPRLVKLLLHPNLHIVQPALRAVGNIVCTEGDRDYCPMMVALGVVPALVRLIDSPNKDLQKEACWTLSNVAAGAEDQIRVVIEHKAVPKLVALATNPASDPDVINEACWVLLNAASCGSEAQIEHLVQHGCVGVMSSLLSDDSMVMIALEGLDRILQFGALRASRTGGMNEHAALVDVHKLQSLRESPLSSVRKKAVRLWQDHFVVCAICNSPFALRTRLVSFCSECKCFVCGKCDCTVFHLSYQAQLWDNMATSESAKQESKRSKRARKKAKDKERKASGKPSDSVAASAPSAAGAAGPTPVAAHTVVPATSGTETSTASSSRVAPKGSSPPHAPRPAEPPVAPALPATRGMKKSTRTRAAPGGSSSPRQRPQPACGAAPPTLAVQLPKHVLEDRALPLSSDVFSPDTSAQALEFNDRMVSFLQETGSILQLAQLLEDYD